MKKYILISALIITAFSKAQTDIVLDTIYANDTKNVALFFPEPIRQGITGSDNFVFTFNREKEQFLGLLQAKPGKESNLLVVNKNGDVFSYILRYKSQLSKLNYFIPLSSSIGNEKTKLILPILNEEESNNANYYFRACTYLLNKKQPIRILQKRKYGVMLSVKNIVFDKEELYFVVQIDNKSALDYDLNFLNLSIESLQKGKRKSLQRLYQTPLYKHNMPSKIRENETARFICVMPKLSLSNDSRVILELNEKDGERNIELRISHRYVNNPN